jgi:hypothetical protein
MAFGATSTLLYLMAVISRSAADIFRFVGGAEAALAASITMARSVPTNGESAEALTKNNHTQGVVMSHRNASLTRP